MMFESVRCSYLRHLVIPMLRMLGPRRATTLGAWLGRQIHAVALHGRTTAAERLRRAFGDMEGDRIDWDSIIRGMFEHVGRFWTELPFVKRTLGGDDWAAYVRLENGGPLHELARSGRGCLVAVSCLGNPAVGALILGQMFQPIHVVADGPANPAMHSWYRAACSHPLVRIIETRDAAVRLPDILRGGGAVMILVDQPCRRGRGVDARFLGSAFRAYPTVGMLAAHLRIPVGIVSCRRRVEEFSFNLTLHETIESDGDDRAAIGSVVRRVLRVLEDAILESPEQYPWFLLPPSETKQNEVGSRCRHPNSTPDPISPRRPGPDLLEQFAQCRSVRTCVSRLISFRAATVRERSRSTSAPPLPYLPTSVGVREWRTFTRATRWNCANSDRSMESHADRDDSHSYIV